MANKSRMYVCRCRRMTSDPGAFRRGKVFDSIRKSDRVMADDCECVILKKSGQHGKRVLKADFTMAE